MSENCTAYTRVTYSDANCMDMVSITHHSYPSSCQTSMVDNLFYGTNSEAWTCLFGEALPVSENSFVYR